MPIFLGNQQIGFGTLGSTPISTIQQGLFDPSATAFITAAGITGSAALAVNDLVISLKNENIWDSLYAIYPMVGANANAHKLNLKNPQDTNAAYRLNFQGTWTHNSSGSLPNGASGTYADTFLVPNGLLTSDAASFSYYSYSVNAGAFMVEIGCNDGAATTRETLLALRFADNVQYIFMQQGGGAGTIPTDSSGFMIGNQNGTTVTAVRNGSQVFSNTISPQGFPSRSFYLGAQNNGTTSYRNSNRGCSFAHIGGSLTGKLVAFSNIVNNFQKALGRYSY